MSKRKNMTRRSLKFSNLGFVANEIIVTNCSEIMVAETIKKNGRSLKSHMSKENYKIIGG